MKLFVLSAFVMMHLTTDPAAERIQRTATIYVEGTLEKVFPLFGPIGERAWAPGWNPEVLYPENGIAEEHMIFRTKGRYADEETFTWVIAQYDSEKHLIEYHVTGGTRIWFIRVLCEASGNRTKATISYTYTGFTEEDISRNKEALASMYQAALKDWEEAINNYLRGSK